MKAPHKEKLDSNKKPPWISIYWESLELGILILHKYHLLTYGNMSSRIAYIGSPEHAIQIYLLGCTKLAFLNENLLNKSALEKTFWRERLPSEDCSDDFVECFEAYIFIAAHTQALYGKWLPICLHIHRLFIFVCYRRLNLLYLLILSRLHYLDRYSHVLQSTSLYFFFEQPCTVSKSWRQLQLETLSIPQYDVDSQTELQQWYKLSMYQKALETWVLATDRESRYKNLKRIRILMQATVSRDCQ